jgi:hypothetical protein
MVGLINDFDTMNGITKIPDTSYMPIRASNWDEMLTVVPSLKFKKNDNVSFKFRGKILNGKITKIGKYGVDVKANNGFYYCHDIDIAGFFRKSNQTKNYM